jgi:malonyl CoA-acyl carrier protein transacylase
MLSQVNWVKAIQNIRNLGYKTYFEIGPSKILKDLVAKIDADLHVDSIALYTEIETFAGNL